VSGDGSGLWLPSQDVLHRLAVGKLKAGEEADTSAIGRELMWRRGVGRRDERGICAEGR